MYEEELKGILSQITLMDDLLFRCIFNNNPELIRFILDPVLSRLGFDNYEIKKVHEQEHLTNLFHKETIIDLVVELKSGERILIEVQNTDLPKMSSKRIRYEESMFDTHSLLKGEDYDQLSERICIIISQKNLLKNKLAFNLIRRFNQEDRSLFEDGTYLIFLSNNSEDLQNREIAELVRDMAEKNIKDVKNPIIRKIYDFKSKKGEKTMVYTEFQQLLDKARKDGLEEGEEIGKEKGREEGILITELKYKPIIKNLENEKLQLQRQLKNSSSET